MESIKKEAMEITEEDALVQDLQMVREEMKLIKKGAMEMTTEKAAVQDLQQQRRPNITASVVLTGSSTGLNNDTMVGFDEVLRETMDKLIAYGGVRRVIPIFGMGGIGKTNLAKNLYSQTLVKEHFDIRAWVTISRQFNTKELLCEALSQAKKVSREQFVRMSEDEVQVEVYQYLSHKRFLIVMDDMWSIDSWNKIELFFPEHSNGSRVLVTTRLSTVSSQLDNNNGIEMKLLGEDSSWILFSKTVFGGETFPYELEQIGKMIVGSCQGLPLAIVVIGGLLRKLQHTQECWESIRKKIYSVVNLENEEHCLKILKISYDHLPVHLKPCFLFMGVFPEDWEFRVSTLLRLRVAEGFLKPQSGESLETTAEEYFKDLVDRNLLLVNGMTSDGKVKYCKIHDLLRDLCLREAQQEKFYSVIEPHSYPDMHQEPRIVVPKSTSKDKLLDALQSMSHAHSLICDGKNVLLKRSYGLLRSSHAIDVSIYNYQSDEKLPNDVFELVNLRYLAVGVGFSPKLPLSINLLWTINLLWNLHTIIVNNPLVVKATAEIWKMPQLRHVHFVEAVHLPNPPSGNDNIVIMENLHSLKKLRNFKCSEEVVKRIPNIKKLHITYNGNERIRPYDDQYYSLSNLRSLHQLESLRLSYNIRNAGYLHNLTFAQSLQKLNLVGRGFDCENVLEKIGSLPLLWKLVLVGGLFKTQKWKTVEGEFRSLRFLELRWCKNLEEWEMADSSHFPRLENLVLLGLELLDEIPSEIGDIPTLRSIELNDCSESAVKSLKRIVEKQQHMQGEEQLSFHAQVVLSWEQEALQSLAAPNFEVQLKY